MKACRDSNGTTVTFVSSDKMRHINKDNLCNSSICNMPLKKKKSLTQSVILKSTLEKRKGILETTITAFLKHLN